MSNLEEFNQRYEAVMKYYGVKPHAPNRARQTAMSNRAITDLRRRWIRRCCCVAASAIFSEAEYAQFLKNLMAQRNAGRRSGWQKSWR